MTDTQDLYSFLSNSFHHIPLLPGLACPSLPFPVLSSPLADGQTNRRTDTRPQGTQFYILEYETLQFNSKDKFIVIFNNNEMRKKKYKTKNKHFNVLGHSASSFFFK